MRAARCRACLRVADRAWPGFAWPGFAWPGLGTGFACKGLAVPICSMLEHDGSRALRGGEGSLRMALATHPAARLSVRRTAWVALILGACLLLTPGAARVSAQPGPQPSGDRPVDRQVLLVDVKGAIGVVSAEQLAKALQRAAASGAQALVIRLDTPGGLLSSTREMIQAILASRVPVVTFVAPNGSRAASAGTYLMYASHVAAMAPSTHLGAATPISLSPGGLPGSPPPQSPPQQPDPAKDGKDRPAS